MRSPITPASAPFSRFIVSRNDESPRARKHGGFQYVHRRYRVPFARGASARSAAPGRQSVPQLLRPQSRRRGLCPLPRAGAVRRRARAAAGRRRSVPATPATHSEMVPVLGNKGAGKTHLLHSIKHGDGRRLAAAGHAGHLSEGHRVPRIPAVSGHRHAPGRRQAEGRAAAGISSARSWCRGLLHQALARLDAATSNSTCSRPRPGPLDAQARPGQSARPRNGRSG